MGKNEVLRGIGAVGGAASIGLGAAAVTSVVRDEVQMNYPEYGFLSQQEVSNRIDSAPDSLSSQEKNFIIKYLTPFLNQSSLDEILKLSRRCKETNKRLVFRGTPFYENEGELIAFVPWQVECSTLTATPTHKAYTPISVPPLESQLLRISSGMISNSLHSSQQPYLNFGTQANPREIAGSSSISQYGVDETGQLVNAHPELSNMEVTLLSEEQFAKETNRSYQKHGFCMLVPKYLSESRVAFQEHTYTYIHPTTGEAWKIVICSHEVIEEPVGPKVYEVNAFPPEVRAFFAKLFQVSLPLELGQENKIEVVVEQDGKPVTVTIYRSSQNTEEKNGVTSTTMGYRKSQLLELPPELEENKSLSTRLFAGIVLMILGTGGVTASMKKYVQQAFATQKKTFKEKRLLKQDTRRTYQPYEKSPSVKTSARTKQLDEEAFVDPDTFFWLEAKELQGEVANLSEQEVIDIVFYLLTKSKKEGLSLEEQKKHMHWEERVRERVKVSAREVTPILSEAQKISQTNNFGPFQTHLEIIKRRVVVEQIGGDSVVLNYKIIDADRTTLAHLYIAIDLKDKGIYLELTPGELTISQEEKKIAQETIFQEKTEEEEALTVEQVATMITQRIVELMTAEELSSEEFLFLRQRCIELGEQNKTYSLVKKEVKRQLTEKIENGGIPVINRGAKNNGFEHLLADRVYDYFMEAQTSASEYESFTQKSKNYLEDKFSVVLKETAAKAWETRTGNRVMMVQVLEKGKRKIKLLFSDNNH